PVRVKITQYNHPDVSSESFYFLYVPKWKGVIVPSREKNGVGGTGSQEVPCRVHRKIPAAPIMVVPVFRRKNGGYRKPDQSCQYTRDCKILVYFPDGMG